MRHPDAAASVSLALDERRRWKGAEFGSVTLVHLLRWRLEESTVLCRTPPAAVISFGYPLSGILPLFLKKTKHYHLPSFSTILYYQLHLLLA
jgi:hypothetical protein